MAYIICVQPALLSGQLTGTDTGMPFSPLITTTCLASAIGCFLMGIIANYPIGLAPGMGANFFMLFSVMGGCASAIGVSIGEPVVWQTALAVVLASGIVFFAISFTSLRKAVILSLSPSMKNSIVASLGLFIAYLGLKNGGIVSIEQSTPTLSASLSDVSTIIFGTSLVFIVALMHWKIKGEILYGIGASALIAALCGKLELTGIAGVPASPVPLLFKTDLNSLFRHLWELLPLIFVCFFMDLFDTMGTVLGVTANAGLAKDGSIERLDRVFMADAAATVSGALLGHSTVTAYVESTAGTEVGGRTGLTAIVVGICFLLALIFTPLIMALASCPVVTASALVVVGTLMMRSVKEIDWDEFSEAVPALLVIGGISFTTSIISGIALGLIPYPLLKLCSGKAKEVSWFTWLTAIGLCVYLLLLK